MSSFQALASALAELIERKNRAYGDSVTRSANILAILYPEGVKPTDYSDLLLVVRVLDKLSRIATDKDALEETPWRDISGYGLLGWRTDESREKYPTEGE